MNKLKNFFVHLISAIYPKKCICCSELIDEEKQICDSCNSLIERNNLNGICIDCGFEKYECVCKYHVYRFNGLICVFKNKNLAQQAYYSYKFLKKQHYCSFFAEEMANAVLKCYCDIKFDFICSVPSNNRYGYNHCGYIARQMAKILKIPYSENFLHCVKKTKKQHRSTFKERLINVEGKYKCNTRLDNKRILLVDDIKTTGATLDECSKMLLYSGADSVYCITLLGSSTSKN